MRKSAIISFVLSLALGLALNSQAMDMTQSSGQQGGAGMAVSGRSGVNIHNSTVDGLHIAYHLIDMQAKLQEMNMAMPGVKSHHLMIYVTPQGGEPLTGARVGYVISGAAGRQQVMAMAMGDGYGADVDLKKGEEVTIKVKIVAGDKKLVDQFKYTP